MRTIILLSLFFFAFDCVALLYGQLEMFAIFLLLFVLCVTTQVPKILSLKPAKPDIIPDMFVINSDSRRDNFFNKLGLYFLSLPVLFKLFSYEKSKVAEKIPATGKTIDEIHYTIRTSAVTVSVFVVLCVLLVLAVTITGVFYLLFILFTPLLIPILAPIVLDMQANERMHKTSAELLAFLTYSSIVHTVNKTMFWTFFSISTSDMFDSLKNDSQIVLRYAKQGGEEEGASIIKMARYHPNDTFREFLQKYVSYIGTNTTRLGNYVEITRDHMLNDTIDGINSYTGTANAIFFMGTMMVSVVPMMLTIMAFLPNSSFDVTSLLGIMFVIPFVFVIFPIFLSTGSIFLQTQKKISKISLIAIPASFVPLYILFPELWLIILNVSLVLFAGINWGITAKKDVQARGSDSEIPDMLDYIAEQKKSKSNMIDIFKDYARIPNVNETIKDLLYGIISDISIKSTHEAFYANRKFPTKTTQFAFFVIYAIYQHGGGTYETLIEMAHSIRKIVQIKRRFAQSVRFSVILMVLAPVIFTFSVMMVSFMTFGVADADSVSNISGNIMMIKTSDVGDIVQSLQPVALIIAITGGLGLSRITHYTFNHTLYLFLAGVTSLVCLVVWDELFIYMQSLSM